MALAGVVAPPAVPAGAGPDARLQAAEAEVQQLLSLPALTSAQVDRLEQLDDWVAFMPAGGLDGAAVKLRRLLCPREGIFTGRLARLSGADEAAAQDVLRILQVAAKAFTGERFAGRARA